MIEMKDLRRIIIVFTIFRHILQFNSLMQAKTVSLGKHTTLDSFVIHKGFKRMKRQYL